jgi:D-tyrosyl-tRNA(Tyr) deacylase
VRAVVQRVSRACVRVGDEVVAEMGAGLLALVGVAREDAPEDARALAEKLVGLRVFDDAEGKQNLSLLDTRGTLGVVSQFTLLGDCRKGRRPSFADAAPPEVAEPLLARLVLEAQARGAPTVTGRFRARMRLELWNEGPVTLLLDTRRVL